MHTLRFFRDDESGFVNSAEMLLITSLVVLGLVAGSSVVRNAISTELSDLAAGFGQVNQSHSFGGVTGHSSSIAGSFFRDQADFGDNSASGSAGSGTGGLGFVPASPEK